MPLLGILLTAAQPLELFSLQQLVLSPGAVVKQGILRLGGLVARDGTGRYFLFHLKLQDYLRSHLFTSSEIAAFHLRLADWANGNDAAIWETSGDATEETRRAYARAHYVLHLAEGQAWERLWNVLDEGIYGQAKLRYDTSTRSYAQDLDRARLGALNVDTEVPQSILRVWRYSLIRCNLTSRVQNYPPIVLPLIAQLYKEADAINMAELLPQLSTRLDALLRVSAVAEHGQRNSLLLYVAEKVYTSSDVELQANVLTRIATAFIQMEKMAEADSMLRAAQQAAQQISDVEQQANVLTRIATVFIQMEKMAEAIQVAQQISDVEQQAKVLSKIATALSKADRVDDMLQVTQQISDIEQQANMLGNIATALIKMDKMVEAKHMLGVAQQVAQGVGYGHTELMLSSLSQAFAYAGNWQRAEELIERITDEEVQPQALALWAQALIHAGNWMKAMHIILRLDGQNDDYYFINLLICVGLTGNFSAISDLFYEFMSEVIRKQFAERESAQHSQILTFLEARQWQEAEQAAQDVSEPDAHQEVVKIINFHRILMFVQSGQTEAVEHFISVTEDEELQQMSSFTLSLVQVLALIQAEEWEAAERIASELKDEGLQKVIIGLLAGGRVRMYANENDWDRAHRVVEQLGDEDVQQFVRQFLAQILVQANQYHRALTVIHEMTNMEHKAYFLHTMSLCFGERGVWVEAEQLARGIEQPEQRAETLTALARLRRADGDILGTCVLLHGAVQAALRITNAKIQGNVLNAICACACHLSSTPSFLSLLRSSWAQATTRDELLGLLPLAAPLIRANPALGMQLYEGMQWVDDFLKG